MSAQSARSIPLSASEIATGVVLAADALAASAQHRHQHHQHHASPPPSSQPGDHGSPEGWKFTWPAGDATKGREEVFVKLECYKCHEVRGETFPGASAPEAVGPELSGMAAHHPPEFFAESIINPNAVVDPGEGFRGPDGSTKMPSFSESMTVQEVIDLVAYLVSLQPPAPAAADDHKH